MIACRFSNLGSSATSLLDFDDITAAVPSVLVASLLLLPRHTNTDHHGRTNKSRNRPGLQNPEITKGQQGKRRISANVWRWDRFIQDRVLTTFLDIFLDRCVSIVKLVIQLGQASLLECISVSIAPACIGTWVCTSVSSGTHYSRGCPLVLSPSRPMIEC